MMMISVWLSDDFSLSNWNNVVLLVLFILLSSRVVFKREEEEDEGDAPAVNVSMLIRQM